MNGRVEWGGVEEEVGVWAGTSRLASFLPVDTMQRVLMQEAGSRQLMNSASLKNRDKRAGC